MTHWAFIGADGLIPSVVQFAQDYTPWLSTVRCSVEDFHRGGGRGECLRIPIAKPMTSDDWERPHKVPGLDIYVGIRADLPPLDYKDRVHLVDLIPSRAVRVGYIEGDAP